MNNELTLAFYRAGALKINQFILLFLEDHSQRFLFQPEITVFVLTIVWPNESYDKDTQLNIVHLATSTVRAIFLTRISI